jgi:hypothetical protein
LKFLLSDFRFRFSDFISRISNILSEVANAIFKQRDCQRLGFGLYFSGHVLPIFCQRCSWILVREMRGAVHERLKGILTFVAPL